MASNTSQTSEVDVDAICYRRRLRLYSLLVGTPFVVPLRVKMTHYGALCVGPLTIHVEHDRFVFTLETWVPKFDTSRGGTYEGFDAQSFTAVGATPEQAVEAVRAVLTALYAGPS